jgi:DNA-binding beta-propeller fold protein YncE
MTLTAVGSVAIPPFRASGFDHGDVHLATGRTFVAHTAAGTVEVIDGRRQVHVLTIPGCREASGVLCAQEAGLVFAAARGAGAILTIDATALVTAGEMASGPSPNGLAWDGRRGRLLAADVQDLSARLLDPSTGRSLARLELPGRPRWCVYDARTDRFLVNVREPASVVLLTAEPLALAGTWPVPAAGPHGLDLDPRERRAFVACDGGSLAVLDLDTGTVVAEVPIGGPPDAIWFNQERHLLYVAIGDPGLVDVIDTRALRRTEQVVTEAGAHTTAFDAARQRLTVFLPASCRAAIYQEA